MFDNVHTKTTVYLLVSIFCLTGILIPIPLAPITFFVSAGLLVLSRENYVTVIQEGQAEVLRVKLGLTMAICLGNILATLLMATLIGVAFYIVLSNPQPFRDFSTPPLRSENATTESRRAEINIETFNQSNHYYSR